MTFYVRFFGDHKELSEKDLDKILNKLEALEKEIKDAKKKKD